MTLICKISKKNSDLLKAIKFRTSFVFFFLNENFIYRKYKLKIPFEDLRHDYVYLDRKSYRGIHIIQYILLNLFLQKIKFM